jgi:predicted Fe-Mo cluster-binding NifX family protein
MKVAITVWGSRISPVFDSSHMLLVAEIENSIVIDRKQLAFNPEPPSRLAELLAEMEIDVLICGAVSKAPACLIESVGIKLIPFIAGDAEEILTSYAKKASVPPMYLMPGCGLKTCGEGKRRYCGRSRTGQETE